LGGLVHYALSEYHLGRTTDAAHSLSTVRSLSGIMLVS
jgi:hypothetical protein